MTPTFLKDFFVLTDLGRESVEKFRGEMLTL